MPWLARSSVLLLAALLPPRAQAEDAVVVLTDATFESAVAEGSWLLEFYAPWCGHCKKLAAPFEAAAAAMSGSVNFGKIDCTANPKLKDHFLIKGYPTIKFLRGKVLRDYKGGRSKEDLVRFAKSISGDAIRPVNLVGPDGFADEQAAEALRAAEPISFIYVGPKTAPEYLAFEEVANRNQGLYFFGADTTEPPAEAAGLYDFGPAGVSGRERASVILVTKGQIKFPRVTTQDPTALEAWISARRFPLLAPAGAGTFGQMTNSGRKVVLGVVDGSAASENLKAKLLEAAAAWDIATFSPGPGQGIDSLVTRRLLRDDSGDTVVDFKKENERLKSELAALDSGNMIVATTIDATQFGRYLKRFGISGAPSIVIVDYENELYWKSSDEDPTDSVRSFIDAAMSGSVSPVAMVPWYNPERYIRKISKMLSGLSEMTRLAVIVGFVLGLSGLMFWLILWCEGSAEHPQKRAPIPPPRRTRAPPPDKAKAD